MVSSSQNSKFRGLLASLLLLSSCAVVSAHEPVTLGGHSYINKGPVALGVVPSDFLDDLGDTIGGIGSAIAIKPGTWSFDAKSGTYHGTLVAHTDSGPHGTLKHGYQTRHQEFNITLSPYYGKDNLDFTAARSTLKLAHTKTVLKVGPDGAALGGADPNGVRPAQDGWPALPTFDPRRSKKKKRGSKRNLEAEANDSEVVTVLDSESVVTDTDGTYWIGDEYGPYVYHFSAEKPGSPSRLLSVTQPPRAFLPLNEKGEIEFKPKGNPKTGRAVGQGFECLTMDFETRTLYAMLQSALVQDGGADENGEESDKTSRYTRLVAFDASKSGLGAEGPFRGGDSAQVPIAGVKEDVGGLKVKGEWIIPLPRSSKGKTRASSEILFVGDSTFLAIGRDGGGRGGSDHTSNTKQLDLFSIKSARNIAGTKFDDPSTPAAPGGVLSPEITPAEWVSFLDMIDKNDLAKLGMHNGLPDDHSLIASRWEGLAIAPVCDEKNKDDYFVFAASDNNYASTHGWAVGVPFNEGLDVDSQYLVYRVTFPSVVRGSVERALGIPPCFSS